MTAWYEGVLKVRGRYEDVVRFFENIFFEEDLNEEKRYDGETAFILNEKPYIRMTTRNFIKDGYISIIKRENGTAVVEVEMKEAYGIDTVPYAEFSKKYNVDIKIDAFNRGAGESRHVFIQGGELINNYLGMYDDYVWECIMPTLGG